MIDPHLTYFSDHEFIRGGIQWLPFMPADLVVKSDVLRHQWGHRIFISDHPKALGRRSGSSKSYHNVDKHGILLAMDCQPEGINSQEDAYAFFMLARNVGFTGIGFYPNWNPNPGFHLDVRRERRHGDPATWGFVFRQSRLVQVSINDAIEDYV